MQPSVELITIENVTKKFNGKTVLDNFSSVVKTGQITGLIGRSGAGKSVLLHMLRGNPEYEPDSGRVIYHVHRCISCGNLGLPLEGVHCAKCNADMERVDVDFWNLKEYHPLREAIRQRIAIMLQRTFALWGDKTCIENVLEAIPEDEPKKIEKAKEMLLSRDMKIYEVAEALGFESAYYFSKVFKKHTGQTPSEYRKHMKAMC